MLSYSVAADNNDEFLYSQYLFSWRREKKSKNLFQISFAYFFMVPVRIQLSDFNVINVLMQEFANVYQDLKIIETIFYFRFSEKCSHNIIGHC